MAERTRTMDKDDKNRSISIRAKRWLILLNAYMSVSISIGIFYSINKLFVDIRNTFNSTRAETSAIQSTALGFGFGSGIVTGMMTRRLGVRKTAMIASSLSVVGMLISFFATSVEFLIVSIGIVAATGFGWLALDSIALVGQYFQGTSAALVMSILNTASATGGMVFPYVFGFLLEKYGLRGTFLIISGFLMQTIPLTALWIPPDSSNSGSAKLDDIKGVDNLAVFTVDLPDKMQSSELGKTVVKIRYAENNHRENICINNEIVEEVKSNPGKYSTVIIEKMCQKQEQSRVSVVRLLKRKSFTAYAVSFLQWSLGAFLVVLVDFVIDIGFTQDNASLCLLLINIFSVLGRLCPGFLMQIPSVPVFLPQILAGIFGSVSLLLSAFVNDITLILISCCIFGIALGLTIGSISVTTNRIVSINELPNALGIALSMMGLGNIATGPVIGLMRDLFGSYKTAYLSAVGPLVLAVVLLLLAERWHRTRQQAVRQSVFVAYISNL